MSLQLATVKSKPSHATAEEQPNRPTAGIKIQTEIKLKLNLRMLEKSQAAVGRPSKH